MKKLNRFVPFLSWLFLAGAWLLLTTGCAPREDTPLTPEESEQIKKEVLAAGEPLMAGWLALDGSLALQSFAPDMVSCYDTLLLGYEDYRKSWDEYTAARESIRYTQISEDLIILTRDYVIDTWVGRVEEVMKTGEVVVYNPARYTNVFRKRDGEWKIVFAQNTHTVEEQSAQP